MPGLELSAAVVSVVASNSLKEGVGLTDIDEYFWTDSAVVWGSINNRACHFHMLDSNSV